MEDILAFIVKFLEYEFISNSISNYLLLIFSYIFISFFKRRALMYLIKLLDGVLDMRREVTKSNILRVIKSPFSLCMLMIYILLFKHTLFLSDKILMSINIALNIILNCVVFMTVYKIVSISSGHIKRWLERFNKDVGKDISPFFIKFIKMLITSLFVMSVLDDLGFNVSAFLASLGIGGVVFALAAKDTATNLFGSIMIFTDKPFRIGDWIQTSSVEGVVEEIGIRSTLVRTFSQALVNVPNSNMANEAITNWSRMGKRRIKMTIGLTYSTKTAQIEAILKDIKDMLLHHKDIDNETIFINFTDFGSSSLDIFCYFFATTTKWGEYLDIKEDVNLKIMDIVEKNGSSFAFPSRSIYMEQG